MERQPAIYQAFGHNRPPLDEVLAADFDAMSKEVEQAVANAQAENKAVKNETGLGIVGQQVTTLRTLYKRVDDARKTEKEPALDAGRKIDAFFKGMQEKIETIAKNLQARADDYVRAKAAEERRKREEEARKAREREAAEREKAEAGNTRAAGRADHYEARAEAAEKAATASTADLVRTKAGGVTSSARTTWDFKIDDYQALQATLGPLGPFIAREDVEKAIRSMVRVQKGGVSLPGVSVFESVKSTFRR